MMSNKSIPETVPCPFDPSHQIAKHRLQIHVIKCRRNYTDKKKGVNCLLNDTNQIPEQELSVVQSQTCRLALDKQVSETVENKYPVAPLVVNCTYWDEENVPAYDPQEHCKNNAVLRKAATYTTRSAAEKRNFRKQERRRMHKFADNQNQSTSQDHVSNQPRYPIKESGGVVKRKELPENDHSHISQLMDKISLDSKVVVTPKLDLSDPKNHNNPEQNDVHSGDINYKKEFPKLREPQVSYRNRGPVKSSNSNKRLSRGRGCGKNK